MSTHIHAGHNSDALFSSANFPQITPKELRPTFITTSFYFGVISRAVSPSRAVPTFLIKRFRNPCHCENMSHLIIIPSKVAFQLLNIYFSLLRSSLTLVSFGPYNWSCKTTGLQNICINNNSIIEITDYSYNITLLT